ncbi:MAG: endonuclease/exonuclease/phosphatase family protein [Hyphomicrobiales bacterium]
MPDATEKDRAKPASPAETPLLPPRKRRGRPECLFGLTLGLVGLVASRLGNLWIAFDVFSQFTLQFAAIAAAFGIGLAMPRGRLPVAFVVLIAGVAGIGAWPHLASDRARVLDTAKPGERQITVASFNALYSNHETDAVRAEIERLDADILTLIEIGPHLRPMLASLAARYPYRADCFARDFCNLAILSKLPIAASDSRIDWEGPAMIRAKLGPELGGLTAIATHTIRFPHSRVQFRQVVELSKFVETIPGRKLVMGDFNATPYSRIVNTFAGRTGMRRLTVLPSWPSLIQLPQMAIDHIFVSPDIRATESQRIGNAAGSDHYPISIKLAVPLN